MGSVIREVTCTTCPVGCRVRVSMEDGLPVSVAGNRCNRGVDYAKAEVTDPKRVVTSTVWAVDPNGNRKLLPVRTKSAVPKRLMFNIMKDLAATEVRLPISMGDPVLEDVEGTGVAVVASRSLS